MVYYAKPMHRQDAFIGVGVESSNADFKVTERLCKTVLSLPIDPYKSKDDIETVVTKLKNAINQ